MGWHTTQQKRMALQTPTEQLYPEIIKVRDAIVSKSCTTFHLSTPPPRRPGLAKCLTWCYLARFFGVDAITKCTRDMMVVVHQDTTFTIRFEDVEEINS